MISLAIVCTHLPSLSLKKQIKILKTTTSGQNENHKIIIPYAYGHDVSHTHTHHTSTTAKTPWSMNSHMKLFVMTIHKRGFFPKFLRCNS